MEGQNRHPNTSCYYLTADLKLSCCADGSTHRADTMGSRDALAFGDAESLFAIRPALPSREALPARAVIAIDVTMRNRDLTTWSIYVANCSCSTMRSE